MKLRFVKFFTSRENEIEKKEEGGRSPTTTCLAATQLSRSQSPPSFPLLFSFLFIISALLSLHPAPLAAPPPLQFLLRHGTGEQCPPAVSSPAIPPLPSFFIKSPKQQSVAVVTWRSTLPADPASRSSCSVRAPSSPQARAFRYLACPPSSPPSPISRCCPSTASEAIGKQRPKMRFPVLFPSLTNK